ncbi:type IV toxin-antitoxin system AbiEi family antitoxin domain-containing protein [Jiangella alkaliphila]|uniref:Transcriptional regulator, AbiEi antitoxin, Type IV TA system n=1 Tax=Jiangella alkaliphila TaxID=419479 RepID=A0A1H2L2M1_9ACTN|nr:type IV toxin-antitoxin system AbiEi family antitoxin domain-containing protein [Jiangella alkaliphila]SDU75200.1 Transcriptional regulator, AbiEi antitoxin, Type IV TA system [Jiangella alkaliphila]
MTARLRTLPPDVAELLVRRHGVVDLATAARAGVEEGRLRRLAAAELLVRLAPGCYASAAVLSAASSWERHRLRSRAFALFSDGSTVLTGWSAAVMWHLPTVGPPPARVTAIRPHGAGSVRHGRYADVRIVTVPPGQLRRAQDIDLVSPAWAVLDAARSGAIVPALVADDAATASGDDLAATVLAMARWPGVGRARWVAEHADPLAESPLETLGRFTCLQFDLPLPVANAWVGAVGPEYRVDGLWPHHGVAFEADGALKYDNRPDASLIVARQGEREWRLRRLGLDVVRFGWDVAWRNRDELAARFAAVLRDNAGRDRPVRWWKHLPGIGAVEPQPADWPSRQPSGVVLPAGWNR